MTEITPSSDELPRSRVRARVVASGTGPRQPLGLCRARHAAVEASILASRLRVAGRRARVGRARPPSGARGQDGRPPRAGGNGLRATLRRGANVTEFVVTAPARLHFGMLDPAGIGSRRFGGCGVAVESPRVVVAVRPRSGEEVVAHGSQAERAAEFARRARAAFGLRGGVEVDVREAIPPHIGLGSGTKLGLAIARGVAELAGISAGPEQLADASGRGARSSVGCVDVRGAGPRGRGRRARRRLDQPAGGAAAHAGAVAMRARAARRGRGTVRGC